MEMEAKLDEDFVFYLGFVNSFFKHLNEEDHKHKAEQWLKKLCGEPCHGVERKRCRNIYLSQLLLCMQKRELSKEFFVPLNEVDIMKAMTVFDLKSVEAEEELSPGWLNDSNIPEGEEEPTTRDGRTYLATRTLPDGQGAFAYIAVSLDEQEPKWLGGGEGAFDQHMQQKFQERVPEYEMEKILARRKDPKEREKVITFYTVLLNNIEDELDERIPPKQNKIVNGLLEQLEHDLRDRGKFQQFEELPEDKRRIELLIFLHDRIKTRINKVMKREEVLDEIERTVLTASFFDTSVEESDKMQLPAAMWEQVINKAPNKKLLEQLRDLYPLSVIEKFLELLSNYKEGIAMRIQRRHENIIAQMKKELRREDEKGRKLVEESQTSCEHAMDILAAVKKAYQMKLDVEKRNKQKMEIPKSDHSKLYDEMRAALYETQKCVEDEAERGRELANQIHIVNEQTEMCSKVNEDTIKKIEEENMEIMKNIKRLNRAIKLQQERIDKVHQTVSTKTGAEFEIYF